MNLQNKNMNRGMQSTHDYEINRLLGRRLRLLRTELGLSTKDLARLYGISYQAVCKMENGQSAIPAYRLVQLSQYLHLPAAYFTDVCGSIKVPEQWEAVSLFGLPHEIRKDISGLVVKMRRVCQQGGYHDCT